MTDPIDDDDDGNARALERLAGAWACARAGRADRAMATVESVLAQAGQGAAGAPAVRASAFLLGATCALKLQGQFGQAAALASCAASAAAEADDRVLESRALSLRAVAQARLGDHEGAVDSALFAQRLVESQPPCLEQVQAAEALGVAMFAGRCMAEARHAFGRALQLAGQCSPVVDAMEIHVDLATTVVNLHVAERGERGGRGLPGRQQLLSSLDHHLRLAIEAHADAGAVPLDPIGGPRSELLLRALEVFRDIWRDDADAARARLAALVEAGREGAPPWMPAIARWIELEIALQEGRLPEAGELALDMARLAQGIRHHTLYANALQLRQQVCERMGDLRGAWTAMGQLLESEQLLRVDRLGLRAQHAARELELRHARHAVRRLESDAATFRRLALEDALTGLANRRALEERLARVLAPGRARADACALVFIDVDDFKAINDTHSHQAGDDVLRRIAQLLREQLRDGDLAARVAGDEFAVLLTEPTRAGVAQIGVRIRAAVAGAPWQDLVPGTTVTVSVGWAIACDDDSPATLLHRGDLQMYVDKSARAAR